MSGRFAMVAAITVAYGVAVFGTSWLIGHELGLAVQVAFLAPVAIGAWFVGRFMARTLLRGGS